MTRTQQPTVATPQPHTPTQTKMPMIDSITQEYTFPPTTIPTIDVHQTSMVTHMFKTTHPVALLDQIMSTDKLDWIMQETEQPNFQVGNTIHSMTTDNAPTAPVDNIDKNGMFDFKTQEVPPTTTTATQPMTTDAALATPIANSDSNSMFDFTTQEVHPPTTTTNQPWTTDAAPGVRMLTLFGGKHDIVGTLSSSGNAGFDAYKNPVPGTKHHVQETHLSIAYKDVSNDDNSKTSNPLKQRRGFWCMQHMHQI
jgi:hypothetical protein